MYVDSDTTKSKLLFHGDSLHLVENIPRYTAVTVGMCDTLLCYLVMHAPIKPDSTVDTQWVLHETRQLHNGHFNAMY